MVYGKDFNVEMFKKGLSDLGILLCDEGGLVDDLLGKDFEEVLAEIIKGQGKIVGFECMVDMVDRVFNVLNWHDELVDFRNSNIGFCISEDVNDLDLEQFSLDELRVLSRRVSSELVIREWNGED